jgi:hypothetical protein
VCPLFLSRVYIFCYPILSFSLASSIRPRFTSCFLLLFFVLGVFSRRNENEGGGSDRYKLRFKAPLIHCLVIDDTMVYGLKGALKLRDDTPYASAMMAAAAKKGGDVARLARAMDQLNSGGSGKVLCVLGCVCG